MLLKVIHYPVCSGQPGSGVDPLKPDLPGMEYVEGNSEFLKNFQTPYTGANGSGPILNANANLLPTRDDSYLETANSHDYKLYNGIGVAKQYRKPDSMGGQTDNGFQGLPYPSKMFGRDSRTPDLNYQRDDMMDRARMAFKKMGFRPNETPPMSNYYPWEWNDTNAMGIGGAPIGNPNQYNRNYPVPDADAVARRLYQPTPSRLSKMLVVDTIKESMMPQRTLMHPLKVVTEDRQRMKLQRIPRNADVIESVIYENIMPRGVTSSHGTPKVWQDADVLRQPIGTNDTGDKSVYGIWRNPHSDINPVPSIANEDRLTEYKSDLRYVRGKNPEFEFKMAEDNYKKLNAQKVDDVFKIQPSEHEFPHMASTINGPLYPLSRNANLS